MNELKRQYNELLAKFKKAEQEQEKFIKENPDKTELYANKMAEITLNMGDLLEQIGTVTEYEAENGFDIPEEIMVVENKPQVNTLDVFKDNFKIAGTLAKSTLVPQAYQGSPENIIIAMDMAQRMNLSPFVVMQNLNIIRGKTAWSGSASRMLIENCGKYKDLNIIYIGKKGEDSYGAYLEATRIVDGEKIKGPEVTIKMAKAEGWYSKKDKYGKETSKWSTMTELMLAYRCQSFFARVYCPEALMGMQTTEEVYDVETAENSTNKKRKIL